MRREGSMVSRDRDVDDVHFFVTRLPPALCSALGRQRLLDAEDDFTRELAGERFQKCFLMRTGDRLPEDDSVEMHRITRR